MDHKDDKLFASREIIGCPDCQSLNVAYSRSFKKHRGYGTPKQGQKQGQEDHMVPAMFLPQAWQNVALAWTQRARRQAENVEVSHSKPEECSVPREDPNG